MKKLSILTWRLLEGVSIVNLKPTINYNNILIEALFINIVAVSDSETHSERLAYIKDSERYYIVFVLSSWIVLISGSLLRQVILKIFCYQKGFPETPETPPLYALGTRIMRQNFNASSKYAYGLFGERKLFG